MKLECILDLCPVGHNGEFVDHRKCCRCEYNSLLQGQPDFGWQECSHPDARHCPDVERWENLRSVGSEILAVTLCNGGERMTKEQEVLRFEMTTSQLVEKADRLNIDISDIPLNTQRKRKIFKRIREGGIYAEISEDQS